MSMTTSTWQAQRGDERQPVNRRLYWTMMGLFVAIFAFSAVWNLVDPEGARIDTIDLGFPGYWVYPLAILKLIGLAVILSRRSRVLADVAFAGFVYDLTLALPAHVANGQAIRALLAAITMAITITAFWLDRRWTAAD